MHSHSLVVKKSESIIFRIDRFSYSCIRSLALCKLLGALIPYRCFAEWFVSNRRLLCDRWWIDRLRLYNGRFLRKRWYRCPAHRVSMCKNRLHWRWSIRDRLLFYSIHLFSPLYNSYPVSCVNVHWPVRMNIAVSSSSLQAVVRKGSTQIKCLSFMVFTNN